MSYKVANNNYEGGFFQVLIFESKLDILPKTYQGRTNYIKISIKITHYQLLEWEAIRISRKSNNFLKVPNVPWFPWQQTCILMF